LYSVFNVLRLKVVAKVRGKIKRDGNNSSRQQRMKIFISWSGERSHKAATLLHDWLKCVLNEVQPFVSSEDIRKGKRWLIEISHELQNSSFGIICLTRDNLNSPWILFEAGALSKFTDAQVSALLLGDLTARELEGPLSQFQATPFNKDQVKKLISDINVLLKEKGLTAEILNRVFEKWWPDLEKDINLALAAEEMPEVIRPPEAILTEVLELSRFIAKNVGTIDHNLLEQTKSNEPYRVLVKLSEQGFINSPAGSDFNHPVLVTIGPMPAAEEEKFETIFVSHRGIEHKAIIGKFSDRGVTIEIYFYCEEDYYWSLSFMFHKGSTYGKARMIREDEASSLGLETQAIWRN